MMKLEGIESIEAEDGRKAVQKFQENPCDLVILDIAMPEMDNEARYLWAFTSLAEAWKSSVSANLRLALPSFSAMSRRLAEAWISASSPRTIPPTINTEIKAST